MFTAKGGNRASTIPRHFVRWEVVFTNLTPSHLLATIYSQANVSGLISCGRCLCLYVTLPSRKFHVCKASIDIHNHVGGGEGRADVIPAWASGQVEEPAAVGESCQLVWTGPFFMGG
jgi:hypothetical protein